MLILFDAHYSFRNIFNPNMFSGADAVTLVRLMEIADSLKIFWIFQAVKSIIRENKSAELALILVRRVSVIPACVKNQLRWNVITNFEDFIDPLFEANPPLDEAASAFMYSIECEKYGSHEYQFQYSSDGSALKCPCANCTHMPRHEEI